MLGGEALYPGSQGARGLVLELIKGGYVLTGAGIYGANLEIQENPGNWIKTVKFPEYISPLN